MLSQPRSPSKRRVWPLACLIAGLVLGTALTFALQAVAQEGGAPYNPQMDVNHDGVIDTLDIQSTAAPWNTTGDPALVNLTARGYYQTGALANGSGALTACATGYHMATLAEIFNTASLRYAKETPGAAQSADSGNGPPYGFAGWVRTGTATSNANVVGQGNCSLWTSSLAANFGTTLVLDTSWLGAAPSNISPWNAVTATCSSNRRVWCVQD